MSAGNSLFHLPFCLSKDFILPGRAFRNKKSKHKQNEKLTELGNRLQSFQLEVNSRMNNFEESLTNEMGRLNERLTQLLNKMAAQEALLKSPGEYYASDLKRKGTHG